jgi:hypothetical protein
VIFEPATPGDVWGFKCQHAHCARRTSKEVWELFRPFEASRNRSDTRTVAAVADDRSPVDPSACRECGKESCEDHLPPPPKTSISKALDDLEDALDVAAHGQRIATAGVRYVVDGIVPAYGMLGFLVAYAKVGKTTLGQRLAAAIANGQPFLNHATTRARVLLLAAEDPPEYTAWLARHLEVERGQMLFRRKTIRLGAKELEQICNTIADHEIGLVLVSSWQAVVRGLIRDENDNAGAVTVVENVKAATRLTDIPWLIDAHSGKSEDQADDADPSRAMRGASSAAGAADYSLSLRYGNGPFGTQRRLSGKGRFVDFPPIIFDFDKTTGQYTVIETTGAPEIETTRRLIIESGALTDGPKSAYEIARACGLIGKRGRPTPTHWRRVNAALRGWPEVGRLDTERRGQKTTLYQWLPVEGSVSSP